MRSARALTLTIGCLMLLLGSVTERKTILAYDEAPVAVQRSDAAPAASFSAEQVERLLTQLEINSHELRREAFLQLWRAGAPALTAIQGAQRSDNRQVREFAGALELLIKLEIQPGDQSQTVELFGLITSPNPSNIARLCELGYWQLSLELIQTTPSLQDAFGSAFGQYQLNRIVEHATQEGAPETAWPIIRECIDPGLASWISRKTGLEILPPESDEPIETAEYLFYSGQTEEALNMPIPLPFRLKLISRSFDWQQLESPQLQAQFQTNGPVFAQKAITAALEQTAGDFEAAEALWAEALAAGDGQNGDSIALQTLRQLHSSPQKNQIQLDQLILSLLISGNDEPVEKFIAETEPIDAFSFYIGSGDHSSALDAIGIKSDFSGFEEWLTTQDKLVTNSLRQREVPNSPGVISARVARILLNLGEQEKCERILNALADIGSSQPNIQTKIWSDYILREFSRGEARAKCLVLFRERFLSLSDECQKEVFEALFPEFGSFAFSLWNEIPSQYSQTDDSKWQALKKLYLLDGSYFESEQKTIVATWIRQAYLQSEEIAISSEDLTKLGALARAFDEDSLAIQILQTNLQNRMSSSAINLHWIDAASNWLEMGEPERAVQLLEQLRQQGINFQQAYLLETEALLMSGEFDKAALIDRSRWLRPLAATRFAGGSTYTEVVKFLKDRGETDAALEYASPAFQFVDSGSIFTYLTAADYAALLEEKNDYETSANVQRAVIVEALRPYTTLVHYLWSNGFASTLRGMVANESLARGIACIEREKYEVAERHMQIASCLDPVNIELVVQAYPRLVAKGKTGIANELFSEFEKRMLDQIQDWPSNPTALNNLAWMYARCDQKLDTARDLVKKAIELAPHAPEYVDTLAEIEFRLGEKHQAISTMQACIRLAPRNGSYREKYLKFTSSVDSQ